MGIERPWPLNIVLSHVGFQAHMPHMDIIYIYIYSPRIAPMDVKGIPFLGKIRMYLSDPRLV